MDWNAAIERHRTALKRVLVTLAAMAGLRDRQSAIGSWQSGSTQADGSSSDCRLPIADCLTLPRHLHRAILRLLRPAESAARRLVIVAARDIETPPPPPRFTRSPSPASQGRIKGRGRQQRGSSPVLSLSKDGGGVATGDGGGGLTQPYPVKIALPLFDPLRRMPGQQASRDMPRISIPGWTSPAPLPVPHTPYDAIDARRLTLRLAALARALDDLPREARRFARWRSRSESPLRGSEGRASQATRPVVGGGGSGVRRLSPLRGGAPPGLPSGRRQTHEIHRILDDVHGLAFWALEAPDTS